MIRVFAFAATFFLSAMVTAQTAADPAEVDATVAAIKAANPDIKVVCKGGPDSIRQASTAAIMKLMGEGKIKGNPQAVGGEAGKKIGAECRGG